MVPHLLRLSTVPLALLLAACTAAGPAREPAPDTGSPPGTSAAATASANAAVRATPDAPQRRHDPRQRASSPPSPSVPSPVAVRFDTQTLAALDRQPVTAQVHRTTLQCEGVPLYDLLRANDAVPEGTLRSPHLARYVLVDARDGYRVVFSLAELDPGTGNRPVYVADRCDGEALSAEDGPVRLLAPGDVRAARSVRQVEAITVVVAP